jgi:hypothetical protein
VPDVSSKNTYVAESLCYWVSGVLPLERRKRSSAYTVLSRNSYNDDLEMAVLPLAFGSDEQYLLDWYARVLVLVDWWTGGLVYEKVARVEG